MKVLWRIFFIGIALVLVACGPSTSSKPRETVKKPNIDITNVAANVVRLIKFDGSSTERKSLADVSQADIEENAYIIIPDDNPLSSHFARNPFASETSITTVRPSMWGRSLTLDGIENNLAVWKIGDKVGEPKFQTLAKEKVLEIFGNYEAASLGEGGKGEIFAVTYRGENYALKRGKPSASLDPLSALKQGKEEFQAMEALQFTGGVLKIYGGFLSEVSGDVLPFMIMAKGKETLSDMNERKEKLTNDQVLDAITRFKRMLEAQSGLKIRNTDIKPANLLIDQNNKLVVIDIAHGAYTKGFHGSEGELLTRSLITNLRGISLTGSYVVLDRYYEFDDPEYRRQNIASDYLLTLWMKKRCKSLLPNETSCSSVTNFEEFFALIPRSILVDLAQKTNEHWKDQTGTHDQVTYGPYKTGLPFPNVVDITDAEWQQYFSNAKMGDRFCEDLMLAKLSRRQSEFFQSLLPKYQSYCQDLGNHKYRFAKNFPNSRDPEFRQWVIDAMTPTIKLEVFKRLAATGPRINDMLDDVIQQEFSATDPVGIGLTQLSKYGPQDE